MSLKKSNFTVLSLVAAVTICLALISAIMLNRLERTDEPQPAMSVQMVSSSGLPDPMWNLTPEQNLEVRNILKKLPTAPDTIDSVNGDINKGMGYKGFYLYLISYGKLPYCFVGKGWVVCYHSEQDAEIFHDVDGMLERLFRQIAGLR